MPSSLPSLYRLMSARWRFRLSISAPPGQAR